jgi:hypothetical protein
MHDRHRRQRQGAREEGEAMTTEAMNQAMAELDGWKIQYGIVFDQTNRLCGWSDVPTYTEDLNAVARVVGKLGPITIYRYKKALKHTCGGYYFKGIDATAAQRCEAILRANGKWVKQ